ncbi:hypothetical protein [Mariniblastus fucicola]|uniref:hypothetical protein n=1 Tax=Mariniblastus fucicola TaxID=980251 RepID=UPI001EE4D050|nr:hypothetical protein [Mariniblastus fucicola]
MADDITRFNAGQAVLAVPPSVGYRVKKWTSRNRGSVAIALVTLIMLTETTGFWLASKRAQAETRRVETKRRQDSQIAAITLERKELQRKTQAAEAAAKLKEKEAMILASNGGWGELIDGIKSYESESDLSFSLLQLKLKAADAMSDPDVRAKAMSQVIQHPDYETNSEVIDVFRFLNGEKVSSKRLKAIANSTSTNVEARLVATAMTTLDKAELIDSLEEVWADARNVLHLPAGRLLAQSYLWLGEFDKAKYTAAQMRQVYPDDPFSDFAELWVSALTEDADRYQEALARFKGRASSQEFALAKKVVELLKQANDSFKKWRIPTELAKFNNLSKTILQLVYSPDRKGSALPMPPRYFSKELSEVGRTILMSKLWGNKSTAQTLFQMAEKDDDAKVYFAAAVFYFLAAPQDPKNPRAGNHEFQKAIAACDACLELPCPFPMIHDEALFLRGFLSAAVQITSSKFDDRASTSIDLLEYRRRYGTLPPNQLNALPAIVRLGDPALSKAIVKDCLRGLEGEVLESRANTLIRNSRAIIRENPEFLQLSLLAQIGDNLRKREQSDVTEKLLGQLQEELKSVSESISSPDSKDE